MTIGVPRETYPGERRVALIPDGIPALTKKGFDVIIEAGAGMNAGLTDAAYEAKGAKIAPGREEVFKAADILFMVRTLGANLKTGGEDYPLLREGQMVIGMADPLSEPGEVAKVADRKALAFSLELIPRITRAQSMDVLSSMASIAGYRAVLEAAMLLPKLFPMMMTAAGTITPAKVFILGAGDAGLQAIATAKRLGAVVHAYDVRPAVKEQVESLGGKFVELELETTEAQDAGGYAKELGEEFYRKQR
ncbi:MAG TPA: NAD(P)(+) transhydrogenase (Re/Si-specific) subunit alpha, partial [Bacteroidetes bacterium]|nr:NAD(P)(+) transhydrogenase (Re/Si-specific) subunit alpha [Bacteroidota bacterium]